MKMERAVLHSDFAPSQSYLLHAELYECKMYSCFILHVDINRLGATGLYPRPRQWKSWHEVTNEWRLWNTGRQK